MRSEMHDENTCIERLETSHSVEMKKKYDGIKSLCRQKQGDIKAVNTMSLHQLFGRFLLFFLKQTQYGFSCISP